MSRLQTFKLLSMQLPKLSLIIKENEELVLQRNVVGQATNLMVQELWCTGKKLLIGIFDLL